LPLGEPVDTVPWNNFVIYEGDEPFVSVELVHRPETVTDPRQVDLYRRLYDQMWQRAASGADAVALIQRVATELRGLSRRRVMPIDGADFCTSTAHWAGMSTL
jgi:hypothetical protein